MPKTTENVKKPHSLLPQALNCIEHLLICDEINIEKYDTLTRILELLNDDYIDLGEGIKLQLVDTSK